MGFPSRSFQVIIIFIMALLSAPVMAFIDPCPTGAQDELSQLYINALRSRGEGGSCDAYCEQQYALLERRSCEYGAAGYCYECDPAVCSKYGISCGGGPVPTPPPPDGDIPWIVVVGTLIIIGGGLAVAAKTLGKPKEEKPVRKTPVTGTKAEKKKKKEKLRYILQLSTDKVRIAQDAPAAVTITAWKQVGEEAPVPAPEAAIELFQPGDVPELSIVPLRGSGSVETVFSIRKNAGELGKKGPRTTKVTVVASAEGTGTRAEIEIELTGAYSMEFY